VSTAEATAAPQPGDIIGGRYQLGSILGQGGMGTVWRAIHLELGVDVAVKLIPPSLLASPVAATRFKREARAAAALRSPHVVTVHDYGSDEGRPYLVMELLPGEDLRSRLDRVERLDLETAAPIFASVCKALRIAHDEGIVHRDLKPGNIFLAKLNDEEIVKVLDFGVAKDLHAAADTVKTASDALIGSPRYMSPEQVRGTRIDHRSDLWSASVVLYEMIVGRHPFSGETVGDVLLKIAMDEIAKPSSIVPTLSPAVDDFFAKALERNLDRRFADATRLAAAFRAALQAPPRSDASPTEAPIDRQDVTADLSPRAPGPSSSFGAAVAPPLPAPHPQSSEHFTAAREAGVQATSRGGVVTPDPDATAPALTRRIVGPATNRRWIPAAVASAGVLGAIAAIAWVPPLGEEEHVGAIAAPSGAITATSSDGAPAQPHVAPAPSTSAAFPSTGPIPSASASAAPVVADSAAHAPTTRAGDPPRGTRPPPKPETARPPATPAKGVDPMFGIEDEVP